MNIHEIPQSNLNTTAVSVDSIGALLRKARIAGNLEQPEVAKRLGISLAVIQALEEDNFQDLAPVFVRSYLARYARLLDLSEQEILDRYRQLGLNEPPLRVAGSIKPQAKMSDVRWFSYPLFLALFAWLGWLGLERISTHFDAADTTTIALMDLEEGGSTAIALPQPERNLPLTEAKNDAEVTRRPALTASTASDAAVTARSGDNTTILPWSNNVAAAEAKPLQDRIAGILAAEVEREPAVSINKPMGDPELVLVFADDCWVEVKDANGKRLAYDLMKANTTSTLSGPAPFSLILGNAGAADIRLNGQPIDRAVYMPKRGTVSRFILDAPQRDTLQNAQLVNRFDG